MQPATVQLSRVDSGELPAQRVGVELAPPPQGCEWYLPSCHPPKYAWSARQQRWRNFAAWLA
ncbi:hypothetical protein [Deinococcus radiophilus]|uniref:hypothetical protein n=1 Tax=Deinococcus radiophilus TaxID=32062 RepID=UPI00360C8F32